MLAFLLSLPVRAQELSRSVRVSVDNDYFNFWIASRDRPDDNYSQGARVSWDRPSVPSAARKLACKSRKACGLEIEVGQEMYTPTIDSRTPIPGQRPYAGWLYGRFTVRAADARRTRDVALTAGFTGTPSFAQPVQVGYHRLFGFRHPLGWKYQLPAEAAFVLSGEDSWRISPVGLEGFVDFVPAVRVSLGTLRTSAGAEGRVRIGTLTHPWLASRSNRRVAINGFIGGRVEGVARDLFLDGSTFERSISVDSRPWRSQWERGIHIAVRRVALEYSVTSLSREYATGPAAHTYSTLSLQWMMNQSK